MTIDGQYLLNSDGSPPTLSFWPDGAVSFSDIEVVNSGEITAYYSVSPYAQPELGGVAVSTSSGTAYGPDFNIF
jgi:hypothetical protein